MPKVDAPVTGGTVDTSDPVGSLKSIAMAIGGVGVAVMVLNYGQVFGNFLTSTTDSVTGANASGEDGFSFRGDL